MPEYYDGYYHCPNCDQEYNYESDAIDCCRGSSDDHNTLEDDSSQIIPKVEVPAIHMPSSMREARLVSIEQETAGDSGAAALQEMYEQGIAVSPSVGGGMDDAISEISGGRKIYAEMDGTCGVEIVYCKLRVDEIADAIILGKGIEISRQHARLTFQCGFHVHVSARMAEGNQEWLSQDAVLNARNLFNSMENLLFFIASARWSRHRTNDGGYANPGPYLSNTSKKADQLRMANSDRYFGLNITPYIAARSRACNCNAGRWGFWQDCECNLEGYCPTLEFRLWNATANPTKVKAYIAISQAIVEYADRIARGNEGFAYEIPRENPFSGSLDPFTLKEQLEYLSALPLTHDERKAIAYCISHSDAACVGTDAIDEFIVGVA